MPTYLRSHDDGFALIAAFVDDDFLEDRHVFGGAFDSQISTGHHDTIAKFHNLLERVSIKAGWHFDLGHNIRGEGVLRIELRNQLLDFNDVLRTLDEGQGNPVHPDAQHVLQVRSILGCQARDLQNRIWRIDSLQCRN